MKNLEVTKKTFTFALAFEHKALSSGQKERW